MLKQLHPSAKTEKSSYLPLTSRLSEKTIVIVSDGNNFSSQSVIFKHLFRRMGANENSMTIPYDVFIESPDQKSADLLILRSSKFFSQVQDKLRDSLQKFKEKNPGCKIFVSSIDRNLAAYFEQLKKNSLIDEADFSYMDDLDLLNRGTRLLP